MNALIFALVAGLMMPEKSDQRFSMGLSFCDVPGILDALEVGQGITFLDDGIDRQTFDAKCRSRSVYLRVGAHALQFTLVERIPKKGIPGMIFFDLSPYIHSISNSDDLAEQD